MFLQTTYIPQKDDKNNLIQIIAISKDVTKSKINSLNIDGQIKALNKSQAIIEFDLDGIILDANDNFLNIFGYELKEIKDKHHSLFIDSEYKNSNDYKEFWEKLKKGVFDSGEYLRIKKDGTRIWIQATYNPIFDLDNNIIKIVKFAHDITQDKTLSLYHLGQLEAIKKSQAVIEFDMNGKVLDANEIFLDAMNYKFEEIKGKYHKIFCDKDYVESKDYTLFWEKLKQGRFDTGKYLRYGKDGKKVWIQATYTPILDIDKKPIKVVKFAQDVTLSEMIKKDQLTGFYNREKLILDLNESDIRHNLLVIDINNFSYINDFYGQVVSEKFLIEISKFLLSKISNDFMIYKIQSSKFALLNSSLSKEEFLITIGELKKELKDALIDIGINKVHLFLTYGISFEENSKLINSAEIVTKYARNQNKDLVIYSNDLNIEKGCELNLQWTEKIKTALDNDKIVVYYQPLYNNKTKKIQKYEALVRLIDEEDNVISPFYFLDIAKKSRQYLDITKTIIQKSFEMFKDTPYQFSINLTVEDILDENIKEFLFTKIQEYNYSNNLVLELVESEKISTYEPVYEFINEVKKFGCEIAIDDFGSGYSNFEYLVKIDADYVKIDGSIVQRINDDENSLEIVKSILSFCKKMDIKIIAEFVSCKELFEKINELEIDYSQGYYIGKPENKLIEENLNI